MHVHNDEQSRIADEWIRYGGYSGLIFTIMFLGLAAIPLPDRLETVTALVLPLFLLVGHIGLYHFLSKHRPSMGNQLAVVFGVCAPVLLTAMVTVQLSLVSYMDKYYHPLEEAVRQSQINIWRAVDSVQLGLDVAWDMFILPTVILFSIGMMRHPAFGKILGGIGLLFGVVGAILNIGTFPTPPINVGLPDIGPFVVTWYVVIFVLLIRAHRKMQQSIPAIA